MIAPETLVELGALLEKPVDFADADIVIADLTGVAAQDIAIAKTVWERLAS